MTSSLMSVLKAGSATIVLGTALFVAPAFAQSAAPAAKSDDTTIVVTGSSIRRKNLETPSPIQIFNAKELAQTGNDNIAAVLTEVTANGAGTLSANNSEAFAGGAAGIALRGLSVGDTLTLIDGHRIAPYPLSDDGERQFTDVQGVPFNAIDTVEVLKDGASSIYGSDAIAGVINIKLKKEITGFEAMAEGGVTQHGGGGTQHYGLSYGVGSLARDGYNVFITAEYRKQNAITLAQRQNEPWGSDNFTSIGGNDLAPGAANVINSGLAQTRTPYLVNPTTGALTFLGSGCNATAMAAQQCTYAAPQVLQSPTQNINVTVGATKDFDNGWEVKVRGSFWDSKGQQTGSSPYSGFNASYPGSSYGGLVSNVIGGVPTVGINAVANYTLPANYLGSGSAAGSYLEGVLPQLGISTINIDSQTMRLAIDVTGKLAGWDVTGSLGISNIETHEDYLNDVNYKTLYSQLTTFNAAGLPLFNPLGGNSQAELNLVAPEFRSTATDALYYAEFNGTRKLADLPGGELHMAVGGSFNDKVLNNPGAVPVLEGLVGGVFSTYAIGKQTDTAGYAELEATMFHTLDLNISGRDDYYDTYGNSFTPKAGFTWKPVSALLLRGTFSKGFRAPAPAEVGTSSTLFGLGAAQDPILCPNGAGGPFPAGTVPAACASNPGYAQTTNPLKPEKSTSFTAGGVFTPFSGLSLTADYYHITIKNEIVTAAELPAYAATVGQPGGPCVRGPDLAIPGVSDGNGNLITAVPLVGPIAACFAGYVNAQTTKTSGIDLEAHYRAKIGQAKVAFSATYTHLINYDLTAPSGVTYELAGTHGPSGVSGDTGNPRDHIDASISGEFGPFSMAVSGYWISSFSITDPSNGTSTCAQALGSAYVFAGQTPGAAAQAYCKVKAFTSVNMVASYKINKMITINGGINNLFDVTAPVDVQTYAGGFTPYDPSLHEDGVIGRSFRLGVNVKY